MVEVFVLCRSEVYIKRWQEHAQSHPGITFHLKSGYSSYYRHMLDALEETKEDYLFLAHDDIWFGREFFEHIPSLLQELAAYAPNWAVVGNAGICIQGERRYRYIRDPHDGPMKSEFIKPVIGVDGNLMLVNKANIAKAGLELPDLGGFHGYDMILGLEALRVGLLSIADHRLAVYHESGGNSEAFQLFVRTELFQNYMAARFINHKIPNINDNLHLDNVIEYSYLIPGEQGDRNDVVELFDKALQTARARKKPSLTIACRTQFNRPALLTRAVLSFAAAMHHTKGLVHVNACLVTDQPQSILENELTRLQALAPELTLSGYHFTIDQDRFSRADLLAKAIKRCETDYIWFVDDDDYIMPNAMTEIGRYLADNGHALITADCMRYEEEWDDIRSDAHFVPKSSRQINRTYGNHVYLSFSGDNFVPICGCIFPVEALRRQLSGMRVSGDYCEDYYLLMLTLTAPRVELVVLNSVISGISIRGKENTVTVSDRSHWNDSYACFMTELLNSEKTGSAAFWSLARPTPQMLRGVIAESIYETQPRSVQLLMRLGYMYIAIRKTLAKPGALRENYAKFRYVLKHGGIKDVFVKIAQWGQRSN